MLGGAQGSFPDNPWPPRSTRSRRPSVTYCAQDRDERSTAAAPHSQSDAALPSSDPPMSPHGQKPKGDSASGGNRARHAGPSGASTAPRQPGSTPSPSQKTAHPAGLPCFSGLLCDACGFLRFAPNLAGIWGPGNKFPGTCMVPASALCYFQLTRGPGKRLCLGGQGTFTVLKSGANATRENCRQDQESVHAWAGCGRPVSGEARVLV